MPIYEFYCPSCGNHLELLFNSTNDTPPICSKCSTVMKKQLSVSNFKLNGKNWAFDHYGLKKASKKEKKKDV